MPKRRRQAKPANQVPYSLIDRQIFSKEGDELGSILTIVNNPEDASVVFAVLRLQYENSGSPLVFAVPPKNLEFGSNGHGTLSMEIGKDLSSDSQALDEKSIEDINRQEELVTLYSYSSQLLLPM
jgi:hypothetical protein